MANYEATRYDFDGSNLIDIEGVNTGIIIPWTTTSAPTGFLECTGAAISRSTYSALFAVVGTTYGAGDGSSTFNLPDLQNNVVISKSPGKSLASTGGADTVAQGGSCSGNLANHTLVESELPSHDHQQAFASQAANIQNTMGMGQSATRNPTATFNQPTTGGGGAHNHNIVGLGFTGATNSVLQPYMALMYVIKT